MDGEDVGAQGLRVAGKRRKVTIEPTVTIAELADVMATTRDTVHRWIESDELGRVIRVGKIIRINASDAQAFIDRHTLKRSIKK